MAVNKNRSRIRSVRDLPNWFSIERYKLLSSYTVQDWAWMVASRLEWRRQYGNKHDSESGAHEWLQDHAHGPRWEVGWRKTGYTEWLRAFLPQVGEKGWWDGGPGDRCVGGLGPALPNERGAIWPILAPEDRERITAIRAREFSAERELLRSLGPDEVRLVYRCEPKEQHRYSSVGGLTRRDAYGFYLDSPQQALIDHHFAPILKDRTQRKRLPSPLPKASRSFFRASFDEYPAPMAKVDLYATDEKIMADFAIWLAGQRKLQDDQAPRSARYTGADFAKWCDYRVLPYHDLYYWATLEGVTIDEGVLDDALFPEISNGDFRHRIRRAKEWADKLITPTTASALYRQRD